MHDVYDKFLAVVNEWKGQATHCHLSVKCELIKTKLRQTSASKGVWFYISDTMGVYLIRRLLDHLWCL